MTWKTHALGGAALGGIAALAAHAPAVQQPLMVGIGAISALVPDLDQPNSKASRYGINRLVAYPLNKLFGHRGFIHSPLLYICLTALMLIAHLPMWLWLSFFAGTMSHLVLDTLNPSGIPWLWPCKKRFHLANIKTDSAGEYLFLAVFGIAAVSLAAKFIPAVLS